MKIIGELRPVLFVSAFGITIEHRLISYREPIKVRNRRGCLYDKSGYCLAEKQAGNWVSTTQRVTAGVARRISLKVK